MEQHQFIEIERVGARVRILSRNWKLYIRWYERKPRLGQGALPAKTTQRGRQPCLGPFRTIDEARAAAAQVSKELDERGVTGYSNRNITVGDAVERLVSAYLTDQKCSPQTCRAYRGRWRHLIDYCRAHDVNPALAGLSLQFAVDFERWLQSRYLPRNGHPNSAKRLMSSGQRRNVVEAAVTLFEKSKLAGWVPADRPNPFRIRSHGRRLRSQNAERTLHSAIDDNFVRDFLAACDEYQLRLFLLALSSGLRSDEIRHMLCEKVDWERRCYTLEPMVSTLGWNTKNGKRRFIPILTQTEPLFKTYFDIAGGSGLLVHNRKLRGARDENAFRSMEIMMAEYSAAMAKIAAQEERVVTPTEQEKVSEKIFLEHGALTKTRIYREFKRVLRKMGAEQIAWPHLTRHFSATQAQEAGVDRFVALSVMGHANIETFDCYCDENLEFISAEWAKVVEKNVPLLDALDRLRSVSTAPAQPVAQG